MCNEVLKNTVVEALGDCKIIEVEAFDILTPTRSTKYVGGREIQIVASRDSAERHD